MTLMTRMTSSTPSMMTNAKQCHAFSLNEITKKCSGLLFDRDLKFLPKTRVVSTPCGKKERIRFILRVMLMVFKIIMILVYNYIYEDHVQNK